MQRILTCDGRFFETNTSHFKWWHFEKLRKRNIGLSYISICYFHEYFKILSLFVLKQNHANHPLKFHHFEQLSKGEISFLPLCQIGIITQATPLNCNYFEQLTNGEIASFCVTFWNRTRPNTPLGRRCPSTIGWQIGKVLAVITSRASTQ